MPGATSSFLLLVAMPFVTSSFLFLVVMPGATLVKSEHVGHVDPNEGKNQCQLGRIEGTSAWPHRSSQDLFGCQSVGKKVIIQTNTIKYMYDC